MFFGEPSRNFSIALQPLQRNLSSGVFFPNTFPPPSRPDQATANSRVISPPLPGSPPGKLDFAASRFYSCLPNPKTSPQTNTFVFILSLQVNPPLYYPSYRSYEPSDDIRRPQGNFPSLSRTFSPRSLFLRDPFPTDLKHPFFFLPPVKNPRLLFPNQF